MTTQYQGYSSINHDISQTSQYEFDEDESQDLQKPNRHNQTYEEAPNFPFLDSLNQITNKIKISDALSNHLMHQCANRIKKYQPQTSRSMTKVQTIHSSRPILQSKPTNSTSPMDSSRTNISSKALSSSNHIYSIKPQHQKENIQFQKENCKSRSRSLLYFQENQTITQIQNQPNFSKQSVKSRHSKIDLPLQIKKCQKIQEQQLAQAYYLPTSLQSNHIQCQKPKYFAKNQQNFINTKRQINLTSRSGYNLSISGLFLQNITKQYENHHPNKENKGSLKEKIQLKLIKDKTKRVKTQFAEPSVLKTKSITTSKLYKPMNPFQTSNPQIILSSDPFENRQQKTLQNKKNKVQLLKEKKLQAEIKECTFKPKTNSRKTLKSSIK